MHNVLAKAYLREWIGIEVSSVLANRVDNLVRNAKGNIGRLRRLMLQN